MSRISFVWVAPGSRANQKSTSQLLTNQNLVQFSAHKGLVGADSLQWPTLRLPLSGCARLRPCCGLPVLLEQPPLSGRDSFPVVESSEEGIGVFVA